MATDLIPVEPIQGEVVVCDSFCTRCGSPRDPDDAFCRGCGTALQQTGTPPIAALVESRRAHTQLAPQISGILNRRWVVISILLVAGPIGLPALWFSPRFSRVTKVITSLLYFGLTVVAPLVAAWYWLDFAMQPLVDAFNQVGIRR